MRERILRLSEVLEVVPVGRTTLWRWERDGKFPRRRQIGPGVIGWLASDIEEWLESREPAETAGAER